MKILLDMNIPLKYSALLENHGIESKRWSDIGAPNALDSEIMAYARDNDFIVLTYDLDFSAILSATHELKPSVAQIRASVLHSEQAVDLISSALLQHENELNNGAVLSVNLKNARLHILPL